MKIMRFFLVCLSTIIIGCSSTESVQSSGKLKKGSSKEAIRSAYLATSLGDDPFLCEECNTFFPEKGFELFSNRNATVHLLFENVQAPFKDIENVGDGKFVKLFEKKQSALDFVSQASPKTLINGATQQDAEIFVNEKNKQVPNLYKNKKDHKYNQARNVLKSSFGGENSEIFNFSENDSYLELLYNQLYDERTTVGFNWEVTFIKAYIQKREERPSWDWADQVNQISYDRAAFGGHNYIRESNKLIENWGAGYARFLKSPVYVSTSGIEKITEKLSRRISDCRYFIQNIPPSKRPNELFCRGFATTGEVLDLSIQDFYVD